MLNSRPLCELPDDPDEFAVLTPGHFIIGSAISVVPEPSSAQISMSKLSRYQLIRRMVEKFWEQWSSEYIQKLRGINKWHRTNPNIQLGSLVLLVDERLQPTKWPMGRVTILHPGKDMLSQSRHSHRASRDQSLRFVHYLWRSLHLILPTSKILIPLIFT